MIWDLWVPHHLPGDEMPFSYQSGSVSLPNLECDPAKRPLTETIWTLAQYVNIRMRIRARPGAMPINITVVHARRHHRRLTSGARAKEA